MPVILSSAENSQQEVALSQGFVVCILHKVDSHDDYKDVHTNHECAPEPVLWFKTDNDRNYEKDYKGNKHNDVFYDFCYGNLASVRL